MANPHGSWIWYELLTTDPNAAIDFYRQIVGWTPSKFPGGAVDYNIMSVGEDGVCGIMKNPAPTAPAWLGYIGVDDVDATVARIEQLGGKIHMPPTDLEGVGRMAMVEDPQGAHFYVMRGSSPDAGTAYGRTELGKASWNELQTTDDAAALAFYSELFGWKKEGAMPMPWGEYSFLTPSGKEEVWGAMMPREKAEHPVAWNFYFRVPDIEAAFAKVKELGGNPVMDPMEVPGGERVFFATDPQGAAFGLVAPK
ncbi:VOC family protein [Sphingomonas sp. MS122]|uniref:VOC family protein n=1 Tax=Sphingomonas sp. MS122 TaxID=3412683 RepID=UPI003C2E7290